IYDALVEMSQLCSAFFLQSSLHLYFRKKELLKEADATWPKPFCHGISPIAFHPTSVRRQMVAGGKVEEPGVLVDVNRRKGLVRNGLQQDILQLFVANTAQVTVRNDGDDALA